MFRTILFESLSLNLVLSSVFSSTEISNEFAVIDAAKPTLTPTVPGFRGLRKLAVTHACVASAIVLISSWSLPELRLNVSATVKPLLKCKSLIVRVGELFAFHIKPYPVKVLPFKKIPVEATKLFCLAFNAACKPII